LDHFKLRNHLVRLELIIIYCSVVRILCGFPSPTKGVTFDVRTGSSAFSTGFGAVSLEELMAAIR